MAAGTGQDRLKEFGRGENEQMPAHQVHDFASSSRSEETPSAGRNDEGKNARLVIADMQFDEAAGGSIMHEPGMGGDPLKSPNIIPSLDEVDEQHYGGLLSESLAFVDGEGPQPGQQTHTADKLTGAMLLARASAAQRRYQLNEDQAIEIYLARLSDPESSQLSATLAAKYGITAKAVRDVWRHNTWAAATKPFWPSRPHSSPGALSSAAVTRAQDKETSEHAHAGESV